MAETDGSEDILEQLGLHPDQLRAQSKLGLSPKGLQDKITSATTETPAAAPTSSGAGGAPSTSPAPAPTIPSTTPATGVPSASATPVKIASPNQPSSLMKNSQAATEAAQGEMNRLIKTGSGISQIQNPFLRTLARVGDVAGRALFPRIEEGIPGTEGHHATLINQQQNRINQGLGEQQKEATAENTEAEAALRNKQAIEGTTGKTGEELVLHDLMTGNNGGPRINPDTGNPYTYVEAWEKTEGIKADAKPKPAAKAPTQEENKRDYQAIIGKVDQGGLPTDAKNVEKSLDAAQKKGLITKEEHATAKGYLAANPTPATNLDVHVEGAKAGEAIKDAHKFYEWQDESGLHWGSGDKVPAGVDAAPVKDLDTKLNSARNMNIVQKSFNQLASHDPAMFNDPTVRAVLATALDEHQARNLGILVAGTGGSLTLPGGFGKIIDQYLQNNAVPAKYQREVKDFIADYYSMKDKLTTVQMAIQNGRMGRSSLPMVLAMFQQLPGASTADATMAQRQLGNIQQLITGVKDQFPDEYLNYKKEPDFKPAEKTVAPGSKTHFTEGNDQWDIPAEKVDAFKRAHPNAQEAHQ